MKVRNIERIENYMIELVSKHEKATYSTVEKLAAYFKEDAVQAFKDVLIHDGNGYIAEMLDDDEIYIWLSENIECVVDFREELNEMKIKETADVVLGEIHDRCSRGIVGMESDDVEEYLYKMLKKKFDI